MRTALKSWFLNSGGASPDAGLTYLQENAKQYFDFTAVAEAAEASPTSILDLSPNARHLETVGSPLVKLKQVGNNTYKTIETYTDNVPTRRYMRFADAAFADQMFRSSFEILFTVMFEDAQPATSLNHDYFGMQANASNRNRLWCRQTYSAPNFIFSAAYTQNTPQVASYGWNTANGLPLVDGPMGQTLIRLKFDFENDIFLMSIDGVEATYTIFVNISTVTDPTTFAAGAIKFCLGAINDQGTVTSTINRMFWLRWAVTPILTPQQLVDVVSYLRLT